jgi:hypothetical protein
MKHHRADGDQHEYERDSHGPLILAAKQMNLRANLITALSPAILNNS